jgi:NADPH:quinone reductase-like Zn-dependent oxidoreductase
VHRYDFIIDMVATHSLSEYRLALTPGGKHIPNTGHGGMGIILKAAVLSLFMSQHRGPVTGKAQREDLVYLTELIEADRVTPVIDGTYPLAGVPEAFRYLEESTPGAKSS